MNAQQIFDTVVNHARQQNRKCADEFDNCMYRHNGDKCFAGALIPDNVYDPRMEGASITSVLEGKFLGSDGLTKQALENLGVHGFADNSTLIRRLQITHDENPPELWEINFVYLAARFHLTYTPKEPS